MAEARPSTRAEALLVSCATFTIWALAVHGVPGHAGVVIRERRSDPGLYVADPKPLALAPQAPHRREGSWSSLTESPSVSMPRSRATDGGHPGHHGRRGPGAGEAHGQGNVGQMHGAGVLA